MPSVSKKQQRFMGAELVRSRKGKGTQTGMSENQLKDYASTKHEGLPVSKAKGEKNQRTQQVVAKKGKGKRGGY